MLWLNGIWLLFVTDTDANGNSSIHKERIDHTRHIIQNTSDIEHYDEPPEQDEENGTDDQDEIKQEQKHKVDHSQEHDNNNKEVNAVCPQHQQEDVPDQDKAQEEGRDSTEPGDTEQVDTFFSTMSHRYEHATLEGHIL